MVKLDQYGEEIWRKRIESSSSIQLGLVSGNSIAIDENLNSIFITGGIRGSADFGGVVLPENDKNIFLARYSLDGQLVWVKKMGSWSGAASHIEQGNKVIIGESGIIYLAGTIGKDGDFDGTPISAYDNPYTSNLYYDPFVAKYTATGKLLWVTHAGSPGETDFIYSMVKDSLEDLFVGGISYDGAIFGDFTLNNDDGYRIGYVSKILEQPKDILELSKQSLSYPAVSSLEKSADVICNVDWNMVIDVPWITVDLPTNSKSATVTIKLDSNLSVQPRTSVIRFISNSGSERELLITQAASPVVVDPPIITGASQFDSSYYVSLYPNPVEGNEAIILLQGDVHDMFVSITDLNGSEIGGVKFNGASIDISTLSKGIYLLRISTPSFKVIRRLIKL